MFVTALYFSQVPASPRLLLVETADETAVDEATSLNRHSRVSFDCHATDHDCHERECNNDCYMHAHSWELSDCVEDCAMSRAQM